EIDGSSTLAFPSGSSITTNQASVILFGSTSVFTAINSLNNNQGSFQLQFMRVFNTAGSLTNSGMFLVDNFSTLTMPGGSTLTNSGTFAGQGSVTIPTISNSGTFSQSSGTLNVTGSFTNTGTATIGGTQNWTSGINFNNNANTATFNSDAGSASALKLK